MPGRPSFKLTRKMTLDSLAGDGVANLKFGRLFACLSSIASLVLLIVSFTFFDELRYFNALADISAAAGYTEGFPALRVDIYLMIFGGVIMFVGSIIGFWGSHCNNKGVVIVYFVVTVTGAALALAGAVLGGTVINDMALILCESEDCNPRDGFASGPFTSRQLELVVVELALFDQCCITKHLEWSNQQDFYTNQSGINSIELYQKRVQQKAFGECVDAPLDVQTGNCDGTEKVPAIVGEVVPSVGKLLCSCAPKDSSYLGVRQALVNENMATCDILNGATFTLDDSVKIPTTNFALLSILKGQPGYVDYFNANPEDKAGIQVPLVGTPGLPWDKAVFPNGGLGCGLGMTKGFLWFSALYVDSVLRPIMSTSVATSVVALIAAILSVCFLSMAKNDDLDLLDYADENQFLAPVKMTSELETPAASKQVKVSKKDRDSLEEQITSFYEQHEPSKLTNNGRIHPDVVDFALTQGVEALNQKLRKKYRADLNNPAGYRASMNVDNIIGEQIVQKDVNDII